MASGITWIKPSGLFVQTSCDRVERCPRYACRCPRSVEQSCPKAGASARQSQPTPIKKKYRERQPSGLDHRLGGIRSAHWDHTLQHMARSHIRHFSWNMIMLYVTRVMWTSFCEWLQCWVSWSVHDRRNIHTASSEAEAHVSNQACPSYFTSRHRMMCSQFQYSVWRSKHVRNFVSSHQLCPPKFDIFISFLLALTWLCPCNLCLWRPSFNRCLRSTRCWLSWSQCVPPFKW